MAATYAEPWQQALFSAALKADDHVAMLILKAAFGWNRLPPAFGPSCVITPDGYVLTNMIDKDGRGHTGYSLGEIRQFVDNCRRLSDAACICDADREAFFAELRKWVTADNRDPQAESIV